MSSTTNKEDKKDKAGGGQEVTTTYTYDKAWVSAPIDSGNFKKSSEYVNKAPNIGKEMMVAQNIQLDEYRLTSEQINVLKSNTQQIMPTAEMAAAVRDMVGIETQVSVDTLYIGENVSTPAIGDAKVTLSFVPSGQDISLIGMKKGNQILEYTTKNGATKILVEAGIVPPAAMVSNAQSANKMWGWMFRIGGILLIFGGFKMILAPIVALGMVLPILGAVAGMGTGLISFVLTAVISLVVISLAWLVFRPLVAIPMLIIAVGLLIWVKFYKGTPKKPQAKK